MKSNKKNAAWAAVLASILTVSTISAVAMAADMAADDVTTAQGNIKTELENVLTASNETTKDDVVAAVNALSIDGITITTVAEGDVTINLATKDAAGSIVIAVSIEDDNGDTADTTITLAIAQLDDDTSKDDTSSDDTSSDDTSKDDTSSDDTSKDDTSSDDTSKDDTSSDDTSKDDTSSDDTSKDDTSSDDTSKDDTSSDDTSKDDTSSDDTSKDDTSSDDTSVDSDLSEPDESNSDATIDDVEEKEIDSANNAVEETTEISVTPGTKTTDASGVAITIDAEDSTAAKFTVTPPAKTTDVQTWVTDTVTTTDSTKVAELNKALSAVAEGKAFALDFDLTDENGDPVDLTKPVTVAVPVPTNFAESINDIKVYHVTAEGLVLVESTVEDGAIVFTTTGFSPYIFSTEDLLTVAAPDESGKDNVGTGIALATIPVVIAGAAVVVAARKRKNG